MFVVFDVWTVTVVVVFVVPVVSTVIGGSRLSPVGRICSHRLLRTPFGRICSSRLIVPLVAFVVVVGL